jgi:hypothetical protein
VSSIREGVMTKEVGHIKCPQCDKSLPQNALECDNCGCFIGQLPTKRGATCVNSMVGGSIYQNPKRHGH